MRALAGAALALALAGCGEGKLMGAGDIVTPVINPTERVAYGPGPSQFVERWQPRGRVAGRSPPVVLIHGGCWQAKYDRTIMNAMAEGLKQAGFQVWNVEYRRLGEPGGGYPGTFQDIAAAVDFVRKQTQYADRLVLVGHSAGGHLALWAASRGALPDDSPLRTADPAAVPAVLSIGGVGDLQAAAADPTFSGACGKDTIAQLVGAAARPGDPYADTSPVRFPTADVRQIMMHGAREQVTPAALGEAYVQAVADAGGDASLVTVRGAGHFELISPDSGQWSQVVDAIDRLSRGQQ